MEFFAHSCLDLVQYGFIVLLFMSWCKKSSGVFERIFSRSGNVICREALAVAVRFRLIDT